MASPNTLRLQHKSLTGTDLLGPMPVPVMQGKPNFKKRFLKNIWKTKAKKRAKENNALRKRIKELEKSRNNWHDKYTTLTSQYNDLEKDYNTINESADSEAEAIKQIIDEVSEKIYLGTLDKLRKMDM